MIGWYTSLRLFAALTLLFCAAIVVVRAQPFDDGGLRDQLLSPTCTVPCFLGIRPGVTTREEAILLLRAHPLGGKCANAR